MNSHIHSWPAACTAALILHTLPSLKADTLRLEGAFTSGGGRLEGGGFTLQGQASPAAHPPATGGGFTLEPGPLLVFGVVQPPDDGTPAPPTLGLKLGAGAEGLVLTWAGPGGFVLEESSAPSGSPWTPVAKAPEALEGGWRVGIIRPETHRFFRLHWSKAKP